MLKNENSVAVKLYNLNTAKTKQSKRVGRGTGSGSGKTAGRGTKGQNARTGGGVRPGFEGGHTPLQKLLPKKRGYRSHLNKAAVINVDELEKHFKDGDTVTRKKLVAARMIHANAQKYKVLGEGELKKKLTIFADQASKQARDKIEKAGGVIKLSKVNKPKASKAKKGVKQDVQKVS